MFSFLPLSFSPGNISSSPPCYRRSPSIELKSGRHPLGSSSGSWREKTAASASQDSEGLCTFSLLPEGRVPEGTESSEHRDCPRTGNKTLSWLCCKPSQGDIHPVSCRAVFSLTWFLRKSIIFSLSLSPFSNSFFRSSFS